MRPAEFEALRDDDSVDRDPPVEQGQDGAASSVERRASSRRCLRRWLRRAPGSVRSWNEQTQTMIDQVGGDPDSCVVLQLPDVAEIVGEQQRPEYRW